MTDWCWPLCTPKVDLCNIPSHARFGAIRKHDIHTGVDLYAPEGTPVYAIQEGYVEDVKQFTGESVGSPWWNDTDYVGVEHDCGYIVYGEIKAVVEPHSEVSVGDLLGYVTPVLKRDKGLPTSMLHLELYTKYIADPLVWQPGTSRHHLLENAEVLLHKRLLDTHSSSESYDVIDNFYRDKRANRSQQLYMKHIDEGIIILDSIKARDVTIDAWCLHPMFQSNEDLKSNLESELRYVDSRAIVLAMEYRRVANAYLAHMGNRSPYYIELSPLKEVNQMLWADKVQNYQDLKQFNSNHPNYAGLCKYFENWLTALEGNV